MFGCIFREMVQCFQTISTDKDCRAVVVSGAGKMFTSGTKASWLLYFSMDMLLLQDIDYFKLAELPSIARGEKAAISLF